MDCKIVLFDCKGASASCAKPLMLQTILFCPVLTWVSQELLNCGVQRFFVICDDSWREEIAAAMTGCEVAFFPDTAAALAACEGDVLVIPSPVLPVTAFGQSPVYSADSAVLRRMCDSGAALTDRPAQGKEALYWLPFHNVLELHRAMPLCRDAILSRHIENGVTVMDPTATYIDPRVSVAAGTTILPGTILRGRTVIGADCEIGPHSMIRDSVIGEGTSVNASQVNESTVGAHTTVGPFTYVRPHCRIGDHCRVGDFVEVKNSVIGNGTKISHLTYVGDSDVGRHVNFGCGCVTVNFNGKEKFRTTVGDHAFIGCNTNLVAPVKVGDYGYTAAGSTITKDVPSNALAIARARQENKEDWVLKKKPYRGME